MVLPDHPNQAMCFVMTKVKWLYGTAETIARGKSLPGYGKEVAHELIVKLAKMPDESWAGIDGKERYVYTMMVNIVNDVHRRGDEKTAALDDLSEPMLEKSFAALPAARSTSSQISEDGICFRELRPKLSADDNLLLDRYFEGFSLAEIAERLAVSHDAVRTRMSRLRKKLKLLASGTEQSLPPPTNDSRTAR